MINVTIVPPALESADNLVALLEQRADFIPADSRITRREAALRGLIARLPIADVRGLDPDAPLLLLPRRQLLNRNNLPVKHISFLNSRVS